MLTSVKINLASYEYLDRRLQYFLILGSTLLVLLVTGCNVMMRAHLNREIDFFRQKMMLIETQKEEKEKETLVKRAAALPLDPEAIKKEVDFVNRLIAQDVFPWTRILDALEKNLPEEIYFEDMLMPEGYVRTFLKGYANSMSEVSAYMKEKEADPIFKKMELKEIQVDANPQAQKSVSGLPPVSFQIEIELNLAAVMPEPVYGHLWKSLAATQKEEKK